MDTNSRPAGPQVNRAAWLVAAAVAAALSGVASAGDMVDLGAEPAAGAATKPWSRPSMDARTREKLTAAFALAVSRVAERPECSAMFADLGADALDMLATSLYFPAPAAHRASTCRRAVAYTYVGAAPTFLCSGFSSLTDDHAAQVLVHEALHHAGLTESPADPSGLRSAAIDDMVRKACGFEILNKRRG